MRKKIFLVLLGITLPLLVSAKEVNRNLVAQKVRELEQKSIALQNQVAKEISGREMPSLQDLEKDKKMQEEIGHLEETVSLLKKCLAQKGNALQIPKELEKHFPAPAVIHPKPITPASLREQIANLHNQIRNIEKQKIQMIKQLANLQYSQENLERQIAQIQKALAQMENQKKAPTPAKKAEESPKKTPAPGKTPVPTPGPSKNK